MRHGWTLERVLETLKTHETVYAQFMQEFDHFKKDLAFSVPRAPDLLAVAVGVYVESRDLTGAARVATTMKARVETVLLIHGVAPDQASMIAVDTMTELIEPHLSSDRRVFRP